jgi:hypothetical protein
MTHSAQTDPALFYFLVGITLLLVMFLGVLTARGVRGGGAGRDAGPAGRGCR